MCFWDSCRIKEGNWFCRWFAEPRVGHATAPVTESFIVQKPLQSLSDGER